MTKTILQNGRVKITDENGRIRIFFDNTYIAVIDSNIEYTTFKPELTIFSDLHAEELESGKYPTIRAVYKFENEILANKIKGVSQ